MYKFISALAIFMAAVASPPVTAGNADARDNPSPQPAYDIPRAEGYASADPGYAVFDIIIIRPLSFATTVIGTALFVASSPLTALASIPAPHNAFDISYKTLIRIPARYTFVRPIGDKTLAGYDTQYGKTTPTVQNTPY